MKFSIVLLTASFVCLVANAKERNQDLINQRARERALAQMARDQELEKQRRDEELSRTFSMAPLGRTTYRIKTAKSGDDVDAFEEREKVRQFQCAQTGQNCRLDETDSN